MLEGEVLVGEGLGAVDAGRARAVAVEEVASLEHEGGDLESVSRVDEEGWKGYGGEVGKESGMGDKGKR